MTPNRLAVQRLRVNVRAQLPSFAIKNRVPDGGAIFEALAAKRLSMPPGRHAICKTQAKLKPTAASRPRGGPSSALARAAGRWRRALPLVDEADRSSG
jgi:hypothetical protein